MAASGRMLDTGAEAGPDLPVRAKTHRCRDPCCHHHHLRQHRHHHRWRCIHCCTLRKPLEESIKLSLCNGSDRGYQITRNSSYHSFDQVGFELHLTG